MNICHLVNLSCFLDSFAVNSWSYHKLSNNAIYQYMRVTVRKYKLIYCGFNCLIQFHPDQIVTRAISELQHKGDFGPKPVAGAYDSRPCLLRFGILQIGW